MFDSFLLPADAEDVLAWLYLWPSTAVLTDRRCWGHLVIESDWDDRQRLLAQSPDVVG